MVERSIVWLVKDARRLGYCGATKNRAWWQRRIAAVNLERLLKLGLSNENGSWATA